MLRELESRAGNLDDALGRAKRIEARMRRGDSVDQFELDELANSLTLGLEHALASLKSMAETPETDDREEAPIPVNG